MAPDGDSVGDDDSAWNPVAAFVGAAADAGIAVLAATVPLPTDVRWPAFAAVAAGGLLGGYLAGRLAAGSWRRRTRHGLLAGLLGGAAFAVAAWWSFFPGTPHGALRPANYLLAVGAGRLPSGLAARYDAVLAAGAALACGTTYVAEGVLASGAAPGDGADAALIRD